MIDSRDEGNISLECVEGSGFMCLLTVEIYEWGLVSTVYKFSTCYCVVDVYTDP